MRRAPQTVSTSVLWMIFTCQPGTGFPVASDSAWSIPFAPITYSRPSPMSSAGVDSIPPWPPQICRTVGPRLRFQTRRPVRASRATTTLLPLATITSGRVRPATVTAGA